MSQHYPQPTLHPLTDYEKKQIQFGQAPRAWLEKRLVEMDGEMALAQAALTGWENGYENLLTEASARRQQLQENWSAEIARFQARAIELEKENAQLTTENENFRTSTKHQYETVYYDLIELLSVPPGGSVIETVQKLRREKAEAQLESFGLVEAERERCIDVFLNYDYDEAIHILRAGKG